MGFAYLYGMKIGYARVSTVEQNLDLQLDALTIAGCEKIFMEKITGKVRSRPELDKMLSELRTGDSVIVWKLDRLARSLKDLVSIVGQLKEKGVGFKSLSDNIETNTAQGKLFFHVFGAIAEFEADLIKERTNAGLKAARSRGRIGGRPKGLSTSALQKAKVAKSLYDQKDMTVEEIMSHLSIKSKATFYNYIKSV